MLTHYWSITVLFILCDFLTELQMKDVYLSAKFWAYMIEWFLVWAEI